MKKFLILIPLLFMVSCKKTRTIKETRKYDLEITFNNGEKDTIQVIGNDMYLDKGDLDVYVEDNLYTNYNTVASGVRSFKILKQQIIK